MITIEQIKELAKDRKPGGLGKQVRLATEHVVISIVGGERGLYGDFEDDFEVAIIDRETDQFVTNHFYPELNDDVIGYLPKEKLVELVMKVTKGNFQVL
jgi:hypothetical protein